MIHNVNMPKRLSILIGIPDSQAKFEFGQGKAINTLCTSPENATKHPMEFTEYVRADLIQRYIELAELQEKRRWTNSFADSSNPNFAFHIKEDLAFIDTKIEKLKKELNYEN